jgi:uncharacterized protein (DUF1501 family)
MDRRSMIKSAAALGGLGLITGAGGSIFSRALVGEAARNERILVVLELSGGNDGLNSVVPYGDDAYYRLRPNIGIRPGELLRLDEHWGMNPGMRGFEELWNAGQLAIVHGCGYDRPSFSHTAAMNVWRTAVRSSHREDAWGSRLAAMLVHDAGARFQSPVNDGIAQFRKVAASIAAGLPRQLFYVGFGNNAFDTHVRQRAHHQNLLSQAGDALGAFLRQMELIGQADRVAVLVFSEFGRSATENASLGTDHGTANVMFLAGKSVRGGHYGQPPILTELDAGNNLVHTTDFRRVYATVIDG